MTIVQVTENKVVVSTVGLQGPRGKGILNGQGAPSNSLGIDGEFYIDTSVNKIYGPKEDGSWPSPVSLGGIYVHNQDTSSNTWNISHNLDYYPNVEIVDSAGNVVIGDIQYIDLNNIIINFTDPFAGKAFLS
jgi:hypothetical protein